MPPVDAVVEAGLIAAEVQPPFNVTVLEPIASPSAVEAPTWLAQTWTVYVPCARLDVSHAQVGSVLKARSMFQLPSRYCTQYWY